jgi:hypothetical protein
MSQISFQLRATLSGFNGTRGRKSKTPEEFFNNWLAFKLKKTKDRNLVNEAIANKAEVMRIIETFFQNRQEISGNFPIRVLKKINKTIQKFILNEKQIDLSNITLSPDQQDLLKLLTISKTPIFLTGKAGTGKSLLLQYFRQKSTKNIVVCAPTGVAALNIGGQTIHSLFKIPPELIKKDSLKVDAKTAKLLKYVDVVIIDEISMVRPDLMDGIDYILRKARESMVPFGGVQLIMFGDLYQLPPVVQKDLKDYFAKNYGGNFFFNADVWKNIKFEIRELTTVFRQKDEDFKAILNAVREGNITNEQLEVLNRRAEEEIPSEGVIILTTINSSAKRINEIKLNLLEDKAHEHKAEITGHLEPSAYPTEETLLLKKGAQIMLLRNDKEKRWVNGTLGLIDSLDGEEITVNIDGKIHAVQKETWNKIQYVLNEETNTLDEKVVSSFTQFPLKLAWAITIHKSQGQTYNTVAIDMGFGAFAHGQTYVALSRCKTLEGIYLNRKISREDIIVESKIIDFMQGKIN